MSNFWRNLSCIAAGISAMAGTVALFDRHHRHPMCGCRGGWGPMSYYPFIPFGRSYWRTTPQYPAYPPYPTYPTTPQYPTTPADNSDKTPTAADAVSENQSFTLGRELSKIKTAENPTKFVSDEWSADDKKTLSQKDAYIHQQKYIQYASNLGKSLISYIDRHKKVGDKDGYLSKKEFARYYAFTIAQVEKASKKTEKLTEARVKELEAEGERVFDLLNVVKDDKLDWKEIGTLMAIADRDTKGEYDGEITTAKFAAALKVMADDSKKSVSDTNIKSTYSQMYLKG